MTEAQEKAIRVFEAAQREVSRQMVGKQGNRAEIVYGEAYQGLVVLGLAPQIKLGYRTPKRFITNL